mgnify:CR=1 FL=1
MKNNTLETLIGFLVLIVAGLFLFIASKVSNNMQVISSGIKLSGQFSNVDGINIGSDIKIAGVKVGSVLDVRIDEKTYKAILVLKINKDLNIPTDSLFKISTSGLIGGKFVNIKIGASDELFKDGDVVEFTESSMDLEDLIAKFLFNSGDKNDKNK